MHQLSHVYYMKWPAAHIWLTFELSGVISRLHTGSQFDREIDRRADR